MFCVNCGISISSSWNYCHGCGKSLKQTDDEADLRSREETSGVAVNPEDLHLKDTTDDDEANVRSREGTPGVALNPEDILSKDKADDDDTSWRSREATSGFAVNPEDIPSKDNSGDEQASLRSREATSGVAVNREDIYSKDKTDADLRSREVTPGVAVNHEDLHLKDKTYADEANLRSTEATSGVEVKPDDIHLKDITYDDDASLRSREATSGVAVNPEDNHSKDNSDDDEASLRRREATSGVAVNREDISSKDKTNDDDSDLLQKEATSDVEVNREECHSKVKTDVSDGNAIDSDGIADDELFTEEEAHEFESVVEQSCHADHMNKLENEINSYTKITLRLAVSGSTGSGKSSLINTLRGLKASDQGAAKTGLVETTKEPTCYQFPNNENFSLWDLPGLGSQNFPQDSYLGKVRFSEYDFIILVSSSRFTTEDAWLASEIITRFPQVKLFFIRTKIDTDLINKEADLGKPLTDEEKVHEMKQIKDDICENLSQNGIMDQNIFLVNNHKASEFEFGLFTEKMLTQVSFLKREAFILSLDIQTAQLVPLKIALLRERIEAVSKQAAKAVVNCRGTSKTISEDDILDKEIRMYMQQLGINKQSVDKMAKMYDVAKSRNEVMEAIAFVEKRYEEKMKELRETRKTEKPSAWYSLPFIGRWLELRKYQKESYMILRNMLNACIEANKIVFNTVGQLLRQ